MSGPDAEMVAMCDPLDEAGEQQILDYQRELAEAERAGWRSGCAQVPGLF